MCRPWGDAEAAQQQRVQPGRAARLWLWPPHLSGAVSGLDDPTKLLQEENGAAQEAWWVGCHNINKYIFFLFVEKSFTDKQCTVCDLTW